MLSLIVDSLEIWTNVGCAPPTGCNTDAAKTRPDQAVVVERTRSPPETFVSTRVSAGDASVERRPGQGTAFDQADVSPDWNPSRKMELGGVSRSAWQFWSTSLQVT